LAAAQRGCLDIAGLTRCCDHSERSTRSAAVGAYDRGAGRQGSAATITRHSDVCLGDPRAIGGASLSLDPRSRPSAPIFFAITSLESQAFARSATRFHYHPTGTGKIGIDPLAVVGPQSRVHSIDGRRRCDGSIMPGQISSNANTAAIMIREKVADSIKRNTATTGAPTALPVSPQKMRDGRMLDRQRCWCKPFQSL
jgi:choline dehydrogenase-like flavoprotein